MDESGRNALDFASDKRIAKVGRFTFPDGHLQNCELDSIAYSSARTLFQAAIDFFRLVRLSPGTA